MISDCGVSQAHSSFALFNFYIFIQSFVGCALGIENIGYVMICYGTIDALCSFTFGRMVQCVGHVPFFVLGKCYSTQSVIYLLVF